MKNRSALLRAAALFILLSGVALAPAHTAQALSGQFGLDVAVSPGEVPGTFICSVEIADLQTAEVLSAPRITVRAGEEGVVRSGVSAGETSYDLALTLLVSPGSARYHFTASQAGKLISSQKASFKF